MIEHLASPSVCVVDDEPEDSRPILEALNALYVSCVHISGTVESLPDIPFTTLRLVFFDLHLANTMGKNAASYAANAFTRIVASETAPVVVVIWSKYAEDIVDDDVPEDDQETEADLFKRTLLEAKPEFEGRLVFVQMAKPMPDERSDEWTNNLQAEIRSTLEDQAGIEALWAWETLVNRACTAVGSDLTTVAQAAVQNSDKSLNDGLKDALQTLTCAQGEGDLTPATAPNHMAVVLSQLLTDQLEHHDNEPLRPHGSWLHQMPAQQLGSDFSAQMNSFLLAADVGASTALYIPGTVYRPTNEAAFKRALGQDYNGLISSCSGKLSGPKTDDWNASVAPVLIEISPVCDFVRNRVSAVLVAGVILSESVRKSVKQAESITTTPVFKLRWPKKDFDHDRVHLTFSHLHKFSIPKDSRREWLEPWFRMRELPTSAVRNANAANAARVGYISV